METFKNIIEVVIQLAETKAGLVVVGAIVATIYKFVTSKFPQVKSFVEQHKGAIISGIRYAEKHSAPGTKIDGALEYTIRILKDRGVNVDNKSKDEIIAAIPVIHTEVEAAGNLSK